MYNIRRTLYNVRRTLCNVRLALYNVRRTLYNVYIVTMYTSYKTYTTTHVTSYVPPIASQVIAFYMICMSPKAIVHIIYTSGKKISMSGLLYRTTVVFMFANAAINPIGWSTHM